MRTPHLAAKTAVALVILFCSILLCAQEQAVQTSAVGANPASTVEGAGASRAVVQKKVYVFAVRTNRHVKFSSSEVFHNVLNDLLEYLKTKNVAIAVDEFGGRNHAEGFTPLDTVFTVARDIKADSVLYVEVDRPKTKWLKITARSFDMEQKELWKEEVSNGGGFSGEHGFKACTENLHKLLEKRVGQDGLPVLAEAKAPEARKE